MPYDGRRMNYTVFVYKAEEEGGYWATVAELPGCFTQGETLDEIRENIVDAIQCHLEDATPEEHDPLAATLSVQVPQPV
jgi:predicted RNase H-like HicB family nuclease